MNVSPSYETDEESRFYERCERLERNQLNEILDLLRSAHAIAERKGEGTAWERFADSIKKVGIGSVTARTYRVIESDNQ